MNYIFYKFISLPLNAIAMKWILILRVKGKNICRNLNLNRMSNTPDNVNYF